MGDISRLSKKYAKKGERLETTLNADGSQQYVRGKSTSDRMKTLSAAMKKAMDDSIDAAGKPDFKKKLRGEKQLSDAFFDEMKRGDLEYEYQKKSQKR